MFWSSPDVNPLRIGERDVGSWKPLQQLLKNRLLDVAMTYLFVLMTVAMKRLLGHSTVAPNFATTLANATEHSNRLSILPLTHR